MERLGRPCRAKIFATDVHRSSLDAASMGVYGEKAVAGVSLDRLKKYFSPKADAYQVSAELRQMVVFAPHNIIKDAPFTRLDLVTCCNLLIYLNPNVALMDIGLPQLDGYQVARRVRERFKKDEICLIALTGYGREDDHEAVLDAGFDEHLVKPVSIQELKAVVGRISGRHKPQ